MNKFSLFAAVVLSLTSVAASAAEAASPFTLSLAATRAQSHYGCSATVRCETYANGAALTAGYDFATSTLWPGSQLISSLELSLAQSGNYHGSVGVDAYTKSFRSTAVYYKATLRETDALAIHARLGMAHVVTTTSWEGQSMKNDRDRLAAGLGFSYAIDTHWSVNADLDRMKARYEPAGSSKNINQFSVGMGYRF